MALITSKTLESAHPQKAPYFIRDDKVKGFAAKVNPSGTVQLVAEVRHNGRTIRKTIGQHPHIALKEARQLALSFIHQVKTDQLDKQPASVSLETLFENYIKGDRMKPNTLRNYRHVIFFYLSDWLQRPVAEITRQMVEDRFFKIRDEGIAEGKPTYSQATKTMRILSALMNFAIADELIEGNPVQVLKLKRVDRSTRKRDNYLRATQVRELLDRTAQDAHPVTLAVNLMLYTGLRKNEALKLKWSDIEEVEGIRCLIIRETKNSRPHYVPVTDEMQKILERASNSSLYVFPSTQRKGECVSCERATVRRLSKMIQHDFRCHDLRRTFATRASEVGIEYLTIKRLLNHKSHDITASYIQFQSRENLMVMKEALGRVRY